MALFVPYLLHTLQQAACHAGLEADPCWHMGDGLSVKNGVFFCRIFSTELFGFFVVFYFSKGSRIKPVKTLSF